jgi:hypothetical protein
MGLKVPTMAYGRKRCVDVDNSDVRGRRLEMSKRPRWKGSSSVSSILGPKLFRINRRKVKVGIIGLINQRACRSLQNVT